MYLKTTYNFRNNLCFQSTYQRLIVEWEKVMRPLFYNNKVYKSNQAAQWTKNKKILTRKHSVR